MYLYLYVAIFALLSYLLGSIPSAVWIGRRFYNIDVRQHGSFNAGTTNVLRILGWRAALPVFIVDTLKGLASVLVAYIIPDNVINYGSEEFSIIKIVYGMLAVIGHMYPVFAGFKGGKGVATTLGSSIAICPVAALIALIVFVVIFLISRIVSLSSLIAGILFPMTAFLVCKESPITIKIFAVFVGLLLLYTHRKNISRLIKGCEPKTKFKR